MAKRFLYGRSDVGAHGKPGRRRPIWWAGVAVLTLALLVLLAAAGEWFVYRDRIYPGITVAGVSLSGKTPQQAAAILRQRAKGLPGKFIIRLPGGRSVALDSSQLGLNLDAGKSARRAYEVGREGWIGSRLAGMAGALLGSGRVEPVISFREKSARHAVEQLAAKLDHGPRDASVNIDGADVKVIPSHTGYRLDVSATVRNIHRASENLKARAGAVGRTLEPRVRTPAAEAASGQIRAALSSPLTLTAANHRWVFDPAQVARMIDVSSHGSRLDVGLSREGFERVASGMLSSLEVSPQSASYSVSGDAVEVLPSHTGRRVEEKKLLAAMEGGLFSGDHSFRVQTRMVKPKLTTREAQRLKPTTLLGSYETDYTWDTEPGQMANYRIASNAINNTLVAPGQVFSFDDKTEGLHYQPSKVIENGKVKEALGGGMCQISSTLYMAANYAGLKVLERHPHYAQLPYIRPGFDATVWFGSGSGPDSGRLDMKFKNNTSGYLLLKEWVGSDGYVHAQIWGRPTGRHVTMWSKEVASGPGYTRWVTYKKVTKDGRVLFDGVLHVDTYKPLSI